MTALRRYPHRLFLAECGRTFLATDSSPGLSEQLIKGVHDAVTLRSQRLHVLTQLLVWNRDNFERMQDHLKRFDFERRIKSLIAYLPESSFSNQGNNHSPTVTVIQR